MMNEKDLAETCNAASCTDASPARFIFVDMENVFPADFAALRRGIAQVKLFLGATQKKLSVEWVTAMQALGDDVEYIVVEESRPNALDFHIAYYLGVLAPQHPQATFRIVSNDTGFDPLVKHLCNKGVAVVRAGSLFDDGTTRSVESTALPLTAKERAMVIEHLVRAKESKPKTRSGLRSSLRTAFKRKLGASQVKGLVDTLCELGLVTISGTKVSYHLPGDPVATRKTA